MHNMPRIEVKRPAPQKPRPHSIMSVIDWGEGGGEIGEVGEASNRLRFEGGVQFRQPVAEPASPAAADARLNEWDGEQGGGEKQMGVRGSYANRDPYVLYRREKVSPVDQNWEEAAAELEETFTLATPYYIERELAGALTQEGFNSQVTAGVVRELQGHDAATSAMPSLAGAIAAVESAWDDSNLGLGVLHIPRFAYPILAQQRLLSTVDGQLRTELGGTPVVLGSGYPNWDPSEEDVPAAGVISVTITGPIEGRRSPVMKPTSMSDGTVRDINDFEPLVEQSFCVWWTGEAITQPAYATDL